VSKLSFQKQDCKLLLEDGLIEYRSYLQINNKKQLKDAPGSSIIRDHDITHVIFGLDTSLEQESLLDSWLFSGASWKLKDLLAYGKLPELKELNKYLGREVGYIRLIRMVISLIPTKILIWRRARRMKKKWPFKSYEEYLKMRICDIRDEFGIKILLPEERKLKNPIVWSGLSQN